MAGQIREMAGIARTWTRRMLGTPGLFGRLTGEKAGGLLEIASVEGLIAPSELGKLSYRIGTRSLQVGDLTVTDLIASFPARFSGEPRRFGWLLLDHPGMADRQLVAAAAGSTDNVTPLRRILVGEDGGVYSVRALLWNHQVGGGYNPWHVTFGIDQKGALEVSDGTVVEPSEAVVDSALAVLDLVGRSNGIGSVLWVADTRLSRENEGTELAYHAIPTDLAPLGPAIGRAARRQPADHRSHPLARFMNPPSPSGQVGPGPGGPVSAGSVSTGPGQVGLDAARSVTAAVEGIRAAMASRFPEAAEAVEWEGLPVSLPRLRQLMQTESDPARRRELLDLMAQNNLVRHRAAGGLFSRIDELNAAVRPGGYENFADYAARVYLGTTVQRIRAEVETVAATTQEERGAFIDTMARANDGQLHEADFDYLLGQMHPPVTLTLDEAMAAVQRFYADLGQDPNEHPIFFDLASHPSRPRKFTNTAFVPLSGTSGWVTSNLDPGHVTLDQLAGLVHELFHAWDFRAGSELVQGAYLLVAKGSNAWREGTSRAIESLVFGEGWLRRYLDPEFRRFERGTLEQVSEVRRAAAATQFLRDAGVGLHELHLYGGGGPFEERLRFYGNYRHRVLGFTGDPTDQGGFVWVIPHLATYAGKYPAYSYGRRLGNRLLEGIGRAVAANDTEALRREGAKVNEVLGSGAWMSDDAAIEEVLRRFSL